MPYLCLLITAPNNRFKLIVHESPMATWVATNIAKSNLSTYKSYPDAPSLGSSQPPMNWSKHFSSLEAVQSPEFLAWFTWINVVWEAHRPCHRFLQ